MDLELRHCRALVALAEHGGISRAARSLGLAQSTLSEALLALERAVGAPVTLRAAGPARLSPAGEALLPHARALLAGAEAALAAVADAARSAPVRLGAVESVASYVLPDALAALRPRSPQPEVEVSTGLCASLREAVARGRLDAALVLSPDSGQVDVDPWLEIRPLAAARIVLVGQSRPATVATPSSLSAAAIVLPDAEGALREALGAWFETAGVHPARFRTAGSLEAVKRALAADRRAAGVLPAHAVRAEVERGDLALIPTEPPLPAMRLEAVRVRAKREDPTLVDLLSHLARAELAAIPG